MPDDAPQPAMPSPSLSRGQRACLLGAVVLMLVAVVLWGVAAAGAAGKRQSHAPNTRSDVGTFAGTPEGEHPPADGSLLHDISPAMFRLGFSFVVGFAIAYAARTFLRISLVAVGIFLLLLFGLEYAGIISVHWDAIQHHYDTLLASIRRSFESFRAFITGRLPSTAAALAGLAVGFRKR